MKRNKKDLVTNGLSYFVFISLFGGTIVYFIAAYIANLQEFAVVLVGLVVVMAAATTLAAVFNRIPRRFGQLFRSMSPILASIIVIISLIATTSLGVPVLIVYFTELQLESANAIALSIYFTFLVSSLVFLKGAYAFSKRDVFSHKQLDLHATAMRKLSQKPMTALSHYRHKRLTNIDNPIEQSTEVTRNTLEILCSLIVILTSLMVEVRVLEVRGVWTSPQQDSATSSLGFMIGYLVLLIVKILWDHRKWKLAWEEYWILNRIRFAPDGVVLDGLGRMQTSLHANVSAKEGLEVPHHAEVLAKHYGLDLPVNEEQIEYVNWHDVVARKIGRLDPQLLEEYQVFEALKAEFERMGKGYPGAQFTKLIRRFSILDSKHLIALFPTVFHELVTGFKQETNEELENEFFLNSRIQLDSIRSCSVVPIPSTISWLLAFFLVALTLLPYVLTLGTTMASP